VEIDKPFWMAATETTNAVFQRFFPDHDSRYIDQWWKDHTTPGYPANGPQQPVIRVSQQEAIEFCEKLSAATGQRFSLPSESQWEWACRAGAATPFAFGELDADFSTFANLSDESVHLFVVKGVNPKPASHQDYSAFIPHAANINDGQMTVCDVATYQANAWGLYDMHGNVAEWTRSDYSTEDRRKVVRGGSWRDRPDRARAGFRLPYESWQKVFNVGFRVVSEE
jgi:formylglycine-generating enzyme required for sulfatase activity